MKISNAKHYKSEEGYECDLVIFFSPPDKWVVWIMKYNNGMQIVKVYDSKEEADNVRDIIANFLELKEAE